MDVVAEITRQTGFRQLIMLCRYVNHLQYLYRCRSNLGNNAAARLVPENRD